MRAPPYNRPWLREYGRAFVHGTLAERHAVESLVWGNTRFTRTFHKPWVSHRGDRPIPQLAWQPKVYVCVRPQAYWPTVRRLVEHSRRLGAHWKFYDAPGGHQRPDKIVFYAASERGLGRLVERLAFLLRGTAGHPMRHVCEPADLGLGVERAGVLYVGVDPVFLGTSWRMYRCFASAWAAKNRAYLESLPGGPKRWFSSMNLSRAHEGPAALAPPSSVPAHARRFWKLISA